MTTLVELRKQLDSKAVSVREITGQYLKRIEETNPSLNSFLTVIAEQALQRADHAQKEINRGSQRVLTGIPYAAKDLFCTKGIRTTSGSRILEQYTPPYNATAIERCEDAILLGKNNQDEFAMGSSNEHSAYGPVKNPYDLERVPGGSSGGSAAAVAAGQAVFALATDTAGSIRQPASFCSVVGFKPTYGRISRYGVIAMSSSIDTVGTLTRTVEDAAVLLHELAGSDGRDATMPRHPVEDYTHDLGRGLNRLRVGIPKEYVSLEGMDARVRERFEQVVERVQQQGAEIVEVSLPHTKYALPAYYVLCPSEVSSNLARYDGMQFGHRDPKATTLQEVLVQTREHGFGAEAKRRILIGTFCLSAGYVDAYYKKAQRVRTLIREDFDEAFRLVDVLMTPTSPTLPFRIGERQNDPLAMYAADTFTVPDPLAGVPAISVPTGVIDGLPAAAQLIAPQFKESMLLAAAAGVEQLYSSEHPKLVV